MSASALRDLLRDLGVLVLAQTSAQRAPFDSDFDRIGKVDRSGISVVTFQSSEQNTFLDRQQQVFWQYVNQFGAWIPSASGCYISLFVFHEVYIDLCSMSRISKASVDNRLNELRCAS